MIRYDGVCWSKLVAGATLHTVGALHQPEIVPLPVRYEPEFGGTMPSTFRSPVSTLREGGLVCSAATAKQLLALL
jgi:hypothetical protein